MVKQGGETAWLLVIHIMALKCIFSVQLEKYLYFSEYPYEWTRKQLLKERK